MKYIQMLYNAGRVQQLIHQGNLSPEAINRVINSFGFHQGKQSLSLAYKRANLIWLCINLYRWNYWYKVFKSENNQLFTKIRNVVNRYTFLMPFLKQYETCLVPKISVNQQQNETVLCEKIHQHKLEFEFKYEHWTIHENWKLMNYFERKQSFYLNNTILDELYIKVFERKFDKEIIKKKCFKIGVEMQ